MCLFAVEDLFKFNSLDGLMPGFFCLAIGKLDHDALDGEI